MDAVLRLPIETCIDSYRLASYPVVRKGAWIKAITAEQIKVGDPVVFDNNACADDLNEASLMRAITEVNANWIDERQLKMDCQGEAPRTAAQLWDQLKASQTHWMPQCPASPDGAHYYQAHCSKNDTMFYRCACGDTKP